ncbi:MAG: damage-inducible protein DinB [Xanthomonadaceae bacterium]|nr:damage-inducible protein DinB [Xanthomonadaceae bacterium]
MANPVIIEHVRAMAAYNVWMNERLYAACSQVPDADRKRDLGAFFKSIHGTLNHILLADRIWMGRFEGIPYAFDTLRDELYADFEALKAARHSEDRRILAWVSARSNEELAREVAYVSKVTPKPRRYPLWFALSHFFNHQTHHRGQVTTLLCQLGVDPGLTDLIWLPEFQA